MCGVFACIYVWCLQELKTQKKPLYGQFLHVSMLSNHQFFVLCAILIPPNQRLANFVYWASSYVILAMNEVFRKKVAGATTTTVHLEAKRIVHLLIDTRSTKLSILIKTLSQCNMQYKIQLETKRNQVGSNLPTQF